MKTLQKTSPGLVELSTRNPISKNCSSTHSSSKQTEPLSKYFTTQNSANKEEMECHMFPQSSRCFDSPYKDSLSEIKSLPLTDDPSNDFKTPKSIKNLPKTLHKGTNKQKSNKIKTKKSNNRNYIIKFTKDNFGQSDVNPNHLQMALALSKSTYAVENPDYVDDVEDIPSFLPQEKIPKVKTTLERYGFKSDKPKLHPDLKRDRIQAKKSKTSKFRFITPILKTRTEAERTSLITSKVSLILQENKSSEGNMEQIVRDEEELSSNLLRKFSCKRNIFSANKLNQTEINKFSYYNKNLNISPTKHHCGCLLRNWDDIPGREKSPSRTDYRKCVDNIISNYETMSEKCENLMELDDGHTNTDDICDLKKNSVEYTSYSTVRSPNKDLSSRNSVSPDLFDFDDETHSLPNSPKVNNNFSQSFFNLSPSKKQDLLRTSNLENKSSPRCFENEELEISYSKVFRSNSGIEHFESYNDLENVARQAYVLSQSMEDKETEKVHLRSLKHNDEPLIYDLTQSSESDDCEDVSYDSKTKYTGSQTKNIDNEIREEAFLSYTANEDSDECDLPTSLSKNNIEIDQVQNLFNEDSTRGTFKKTCDDYSTGDLSPYLSDEGSSNKIECIDLHNENSQFHTANKLKTETLVASKEIDGGTSIEDSTQNLSPEDDSSHSKVKDMELYSNNESCSSLHNCFEMPSMCQTNTCNFSDHSTKQEVTMNSSKLLNITDYVNNILKNDLSANQEYTGEDLCPLNSSQGSCSQESIIISDEEEDCLSVNSKDHIKDPNHTGHFYDLTDTDDINEDGQIDKKDVNLNSEYTTEDAGVDPYNLSRSLSSHESIIISDEELNYSSLKSEQADYAKYLKNNESFYELSNIDEDVKKMEPLNSREIDNLHSELKIKYGQQDFPPIHNRITELKNRVSITRESLARAFLEETFTDISENTCKQDLSRKSNLCKKINNPGIQDSAIEDVATPEKVVCSTRQTDVTPENNLIIKTKNITPVINYDEMDTPTINKELQNFGLKPLKRQRGAKLLKYLYDCSHPFVGQTDINELSSDEDADRIVKRSKNTSETSTKYDKHPQTLSKGGDFRNIKRNENIDLVEDLLKKDNQEELIFERKYSVKIPSCRIPLQIVWHNFICSNPEIEESILMYEPLQLEVLHSMLKEQSGCKFHVQDLLNFLDKKCITIRTGQVQEGRKPKHISTT